MRNSIIKFRWKQILGITINNAFCKKYVNHLMIASAGKIALIAQAKRVNVGGQVIDVDQLHQRGDGLIMKVRNGMINYRNVLIGISSARLTTRTLL
jgi:hypothetical protein